MCFESSFLKQALDFKNSQMTRSNPSFELCVSVIECGCTSCSSSGAELTTGDAWASEHEKDSGSQHAGHCLRRVYAEFTLESFLACYFFPLSFSWFQVQHLILPILLYRSFCLSFLVSHFLLKGKVKKNNNNIFYIYQQYGHK